MDQDCWDHTILGMGFQHSFFEGNLVRYKNRSRLGTADNKFQGRP